MIANYNSTAASELMRDTIKEVLQHVAEDLQDKEIDRIVSEYSAKLRAKLMEVACAVPEVVLRHRPELEGRFDINIVFNIKEETRADKT